MLKWGKQSFSYRIYGITDDVNIELHNGIPHTQMSQSLSNELDSGSTLALDSYEILLLYNTPMIILILNFCEFS